MIQRENKEVCPLKAAIYIRVSTFMQVEEGYSLEEQRSLLLQYAREKGYDVFDIYCDAGISGKNLDDRREMLRLIEDIRIDRIQVVLAWKLSRTFRNLREQLDTMEVMKKHDCFFDFKSEGVIDPNKGVGKMQAQIFGMVAEMERDNIAENVAMGMMARARQGLYNGGVVSFGYELVRDGTLKRNASKLVVVPEQAEIVKEAFQMYLEGHGYKHICNTFNKKGYRTKKGKLFSVGTIKGILTNPVYCGMMRWGQYREWSEKGRKGKNPDPVIVKGIHEAIISEETFQRVQTIMEQRGGRPKRKHGDLNILTGILRCPECGAGMVLGRSKGKGGKTNTYYCCGQWKNKGTIACHSNNISLEKANAKVLGEISRLINDEIIIRRIIRSINQETSGHANAAIQDKAYLLEQREKIAKHIDSLRHLFETTDELSPDEYKRKIGDLRMQDDIYSKRLMECNSKVSHCSGGLYSVEEIREVLKGIEPILQSGDVEEIRLLMHLMIDKIEIDPETKEVDSIRITLNSELADFLCVEKEGVPDGTPFFRGEKRGFFLSFVLPA